MVNEAEQFLLCLNRHDASIYKYVYAREIDYTYDSRYDEG